MRRLLVLFLICLSVGFTAPPKNKKVAASRIWAGSTATKPSSVFVDAASAAEAAKVFHDSCPSAKILWLERTKWAGEPVMNIAYEGKCDVPVAGP